MARYANELGEQLTFRVPRPLAHRLKKAAKQMRRKRSEILRLAVEQFLDGLSVRGRPRPFDLVRDLLGSLESGLPDLGQRHRDYLVARLRGERSTRS
ncbi:MAG: ribbon-helix-helix protein, CopG family [bacterium]